MPVNMERNAEPVRVRFEDSDYGPTLAVERDSDGGQHGGVLETVDRLATLVITAGSARGTTFIWDPAEIAVSPIR